MIFKHQFPTKPFFNSREWNNYVCFLATEEMVRFFCPYSKPRLNVGFCNENFTAIIVKCWIKRYWKIKQPQFYSYKKRIMYMNKHKKADEWLKIKRQAATSCPLALNPSLCLPLSFIIPVKVLRSEHVPSIACGDRPASQVTWPRPLSYSNWQR